MICSKKRQQLYKYGKSCWIIDEFFFSKKKKMMINCSFKNKFGCDTIFVLMFFPESFFLVTFKSNTAAIHGTDYPENDSGGASNWYWFVYLIACDGFIELLKLKNHDEYIVVIRLHWLLLASWLYCVWLRLLLAYMYMFVCLFR